MVKQRLAAHTQNQHNRPPDGPPAPGRAARARPPAERPPGEREARDSVRQSARPVIELDFGILVYPPGGRGEPWRAVFTENGQRKYRQGATEAKLAAKLEKVRERLQADAANMERPGADLIKHYLDPDRLSVEERWSRKHAHTQRRLCERFAEPVIGAVTCQDIKTWHTQQIVNAAPTAGEGDRVHGMLSALVAAGIEGGYLTNPRLAMVHWQAAGRPLPAQRVTVSGKSALWVDPAEIPSDSDIGKLGRALAAGLHGARDGLMASTAAYSGLRLGRADRAHHRLSGTIMSTFGPIAPDSGKGASRAHCCWTYVGGLSSRPRPGPTPMTDCSPTPMTDWLCSRRRFTFSVGIDPSAKPTTSNRPSTASARRLSTKTSPADGVDHDIDAARDDRSDRFEEAVDVHDVMRPIGHGRPGAGGRMFWRGAGREGIRVGRGVTMRGSLPLASCGGRRPVRS